jgi:hypothetical protein
MPKSKGPTRAKRNTQKARAMEPAPDLREIMWHFAQAISLVVVCHRSLTTKEDSEEQEALGQAIAMLHTAHNELDIAATRLVRPASSTPSRTGAE